MDDWRALATTETIALLRSAGLQIETWTILSESNRLVLDLRPCRLVAKIVPTDAHGRLARELAVSQHVVAQSGPSAQPASRSGPFRGPTIAISLWEPLVVLAVPSEPAVCLAYTELRACLDTFSQDLPDFREAVRDAALLADRVDLPGVSATDLAFVRGWFARILSRLGSFHWRARALHGDPHSGNVVLTSDGPRWLDLESVCTGPIEWDLSALPACSHMMMHDPELLAVLTILRRLCVVAWCAVKPWPTPVETDAIADHLAALKRLG